MRTPFRVLPAVIAAACLGITSLTPVAAFAAGHDDVESAPSLSVVGDVAFASATAGTVTVRYDCDDTGAAGTTSGTLALTLQTSEDDATPLAHGQVPVVCDDDAASFVVPLTADVAEVVAGPAFLTASVDTGGRLEQAVSVVRTDLTPPAPTQASVRLTVHASPRTVKEGKKIVVQGTIKRDGKRVRGEAVLEFAPDSSGGFDTVKTVRSSREGKFKTSLRATTSGMFRFRYAGDATTSAGVSAAAHVVVKPKHPVKPKKYASCNALVEVYAHGVGRSRAKDKGGDVVTFTRDAKTYGKNKKLDRDKDGIACER